jgi:DNA polymerase IV (DinB-like DNA polymerase)
MLVDLDYFYAQCEERRNPSIRDKPVVVCVYSGRSEDSGAVATANYLARKYGVKSGIPISLAKKRLKDVADAVFLPADRRFYEAVSDRIMGILKSHADNFEQMGIDEAYLDVTKKVQGAYQEAKNLAERIKHDVTAQEGITCSVGVGPNKLVAKIASDIKKPDGLTVVEPAAVKEFLSLLPVDRILGVGAKTTKKMGDLGIRTIGDLARRNVNSLVKEFGEISGKYFHNASNGVDESPVQERVGVESISRIATLKENSRDLGVMLEKAERLCEEVHESLLREGMSFRSFTILVVMKDLTTHSRSKSFESSTSQLDTMKKAAKDLLQRFLSETQGEARRVGVKVSGLRKEEKVQNRITDFLRV